MEEFGLEGPVAQWRAVAAEIRSDILAHGYNAELGSFVQSYNSEWLDGSLLLIPTTGFLPPEDPRIMGTIGAIEKRLLSDGFVMRHDPAELETGLVHGEGAFIACSFWLADARVLTGRGEDAKALFDRLLSLRNDVGLFSEEYDVKNNRLVGNFPQAFSHVALINTAHNLTRSSKPAEQRASAIEGKITRTAAAINPDSRTLRVEVDIPNSNHALVPGLYVQVRFDLETRGSVQLRAAALIFRSKGPQVAVIGSNDIVHFRPITIARDDGDVVEIEAGLSPGDRVALNISDAVADGEKVSVAGSTSKAVAATGPPSASGERVVHDADQAASPTH